MAGNEVDVPDAQSCGALVRAADRGAGGTRRHPSGTTRLAAAPGATQTASTEHPSDESVVCERVLRCRVDCGIPYRGPYHLKA